MAAAGCHVLAIQDTSEIAIPTRPERRRGLGKVGKGKGHGLLLHAMVAVDARKTGSFLGPVTGDVWTREGTVAVPHGKRPLEEKESRRWLETAQAGARGACAGRADHRAPPTGNATSMRCGAGCRTVWNF